MKTDFDSLKVDPNDINTIYRYHSDLTLYPDGSHKMEVTVEDIVVEQIPYDGETYLVPVIFRDVSGNEARGLYGFDTLYQTKGYLDYIVQADGSLIGLDKSTLLNTDDSIVVEFLIQPEGFDPELKELYGKFPNSVK